MLYHGYMTEKTPSQQIDDIITLYGGWKGEILAQLRTAITQADTRIVEEVKWKMPSLPEGRPVWSYEGMVCLAEVFKNDIKLVFFKGVQLNDKSGVFNARLNSKTDRAIELREGDSVDGVAVADLVAQAVNLNMAKAKKE